MDESYNIGDALNPEFAKTVQEVVGGLQLGEPVPHGLLRKLIRLANERLDRNFMPGQPSDFQLQTESVEESEEQSVERKATHRRPLDWNSNNPDDYPAVST